MSFSNSSGFSFKGRNTFNHVHGDQFNHNYHTTITAESVHMYGDNTKVTERPILGQFEDVIRGHVIGIKELYSEDLSQWDWFWQNGKGVLRRWKSAQKTVSTVQIHPNQQSNFTAITYEGEDAHQAWEDDFERFSHASRTGPFKLFGINRSDIPMLIFHHELVPLAHFYTGSFWMNMYISYLVNSKGCLWHDLWLNTSRGVLCKGPHGPNILIRSFDTHRSAIQALPSTVDMLEEGTIITFFSELGSKVDTNFLYCAWRLGEGTYLDDLFPKTTQNHQHEDNNYPYLERLWRNPPRHLPIDIIGGLRFDTVYSPSLEPVARWSAEAPGLWRWWNLCGLVEETQVDGGLRRFKLDDQEQELAVGADFNMRTFQRGWLTQSSRVFDLLKTTTHQDSFHVVNPPWSFELRFERYRFQSKRHEYEAYDNLAAFFKLCDGVEETRYLFVYPVPMSISELIAWMGGQTHFWSFDEDGRSRIPEEEWKQLGIPILTPSTCSDTYMYSWPTHVYATLRKWQIARGFDPSTADWARECDYPEFEIVGEKKDDPFEEVSELPEKSRWRLWIAFPGSDISAFAFKNVIEQLDLFFFWFMYIGYLCIV